MITYLLAKTQDYGEADAVLGAGCWLEPEPQCQGSGTSRTGARARREGRLTRQMRERVEGLALKSQDRLTRWVLM